MATFSVAIGSKVSFLILMLIPAPRQAAGFSGISLQSFFTVFFTVSSTFFLQTKII